MPNCLLNLIPHFHILLSHILMIFLLPFFTYSLYLQDCHVNFYAPLMSLRFLLSSTTRTIRYRGLGTERFKYIYLCITIVK